MKYTKADRRAFLVLAIVMCGIVAGVMHFGRFELPIVEAAPLPNEFIKALKVSERFKTDGTKTYQFKRSNRPDKSYKTYHDYKSSGYSDDDNGSEQSKPSYPTKFSQLTQIDVNTADTALLQRIPGIGSNIARWIVERRDRLGGFYAVDQLLEVRYMEPAMLQWFMVDTSSVRRFHISDMTFAEMSRHPYIGYDKAKAISNYQRLYGPITDFEQLCTTTIFTDEELEKLRNYIF